MEPAEYKRSMKSRYANWRVQIFQKMETRGGQLAETKALCLQWLYLVDRGCFCIASFCMRPWTSPYRCFTISWTVKISSGACESRRQQRSGQGAEPYLWPKVVHFQTGALGTYKTETLSSTRDIFRARRIRSSGTFSPNSCRARRHMSRGLSSFISSPWWSDFGQVWCSRERKIRVKA